MLYCLLLCKFLVFISVTNIIFAFGVLVISHFEQFRPLYSAHRIETILTWVKVITNSYCSCDVVCVHQGDADMKLDEGVGLDNSLRSRRQRFKPEVSFSEVELKTSSPVTDVSGGGCTR